MAQFAVNLVFSLVDKVLGTAAFYTERPPSNLMAGLSHDDKHQRAACEWMQHAHEAAEVFEKRTDEGGEAAQELLKASLWPTSLWCREALIKASETSIRGFRTAHRGRLEECG